MRKFFLAAAVAVASLLGTTTSADAAFQVTLIGNGTSQTIVDNVGLDADGTLNTIQVLNLTLNGVSFSGTFAASNTPGVPLLAFTGAGVNRTTGISPATFSIIASANAFSSPLGGLIATTDATIQNRSMAGANGPGVLGSYLVTSYLDNTNTLATTATPGGTLIGSTSVAGLNGVGAAGNADLTDTRGFNNATQPFTLSFVITGTITGGTAPTNGFAVDVDGNVDVSPTPAPAGLVLALAGMPVFGIGAYIRRRRAVTA